MAEQKFQRKKFFINKRLQIRYMISLLIPMLVLIVFIGLVMYFSQYRFLVAASREMATDIKETIRTNNMYVYDTVDSTAAVCASNAKTVSEVREKLNKYMSGDRNAYGNLLNTAYKILFLGLFIVLIEIAFLTIFISHKLAGPIYRLVKFSEELQAGNFNTKIYLRRGDELTDLAIDFNKTGDFIAETHRRSMSISERALDMLEQGLSDADKVSLLRKEHDAILQRIKI
jgi:methyl-accepting chemotaxis protein